MLKILITLLLGCLGVLAAGAIIWLAVTISKITGALPVVVVLCVIIIYIMGLAVREIFGVL